MPDNEDPLASTTARLSISQVGADGVDANESRKQFLQAYGSARRESVILFEEGENVTGSVINEPLSQTSKRRRSSAQSITSVKKEKLHKRKLKKLNERPSFQLKTKGKKVVSTKNISIPALRDFVLYALTPYSTALPNWVEITKKDEIEKVVVLFVPGLEMSDFNLPESITNTDNYFIPIIKDGVAVDDKRVGFFYNKFDTMLKTICPGSKDSIYLPWHAFTHSTLSPKEKRKIIEDLKSKKLTLPDLLLSEADMTKYGYPIPNSDINKANDDDQDDEKERTVSYIVDTDGYFTTRKFSHEGSHTFALDCEFCKAESGKVLTRISIINFQGEVVLDKYVKPEEEIIDYVTKYSGITPEKLEGVTTTITDIQVEFLSMISQDDILIGHSLESDLNVLKIKHSKIIDTALVYEHVRGPPSRPSLKWLAEKYLARNIQRGESDNSGHSSVEDAEACLDLIKLKLIEGACFGVNMAEMSIYERLNKSIGKPVSSLVVDYAVGNNGMDCLTRDEEKFGLVKRKACNDDQIVEIFREEVHKNYKLMLLKLRELEFNKKWCTPPACFDPQDKSLDPLAKLNERLQTIYSLLPANTGLVVTSSQGDPRDMIALQGVRREFQNAERAGMTPPVTWDIEEILKLKDATIKARRAISFVRVSEVGNESTNSSE